MINHGSWVIKYNDNDAMLMVDFQKIAYRVINSPMIDGWCLDNNFPMKPLIKGVSECVSSHTCTDICD